MTTPTCCPDRWKAPFIPPRPYLLSRQEIDAFFTAAASAADQLAVAMAGGGVLHADALVRAADRRDPRPADRARGPASTSTSTSSGPRETAAAGCRSRPRSRGSSTPATSNPAPGSPAGRTSSSPAPATRSPRPRSRRCSPGSGTQAGLARPSDGRQPRALRFPASLRLRVHRAVADPGQGRARDAALPVALHGPRVRSTAPTTTFTPRPTSWTPTTTSPGRARNCCPRSGSDETRPGNR